MFVKRLLTSLESKPPVVVGIDPDLSRIITSLPDKGKGLPSPQDSDSDYIAAVTSIYLDYSKAIINAVHDLVPMVKPQSAFFEVWGYHGIKVLEEVIRYAQSRNLLVITDVKRGDVPSTAKFYASAYLEEGSPLSSDAITVNPYLGLDSLDPFIDYTQTPTTKNSINPLNSKGLFILLKTSNPGSGDLQDLSLGVRGEKLCEHLAVLLNKKIATHFKIPPNSHQENYSNIGVVVGATHPDIAKQLRSLLPHSFFLVPGLGAQGGDITRIKDYLNPDGRGALFSFSRSIIYPSSQGDSLNGDDLRKNIREAALKCIREVQEHLPRN